MGCIAPKVVHTKQVQSPVTKVIVAAQRTITSSPPFPPLFSCPLLPLPALQDHRLVAVLPASSSGPTKMDDSTSHPLEYPISWDKSMLAMHDTVYRQATLIGSR